MVTRIVVAVFAVSLVFVSACGDAPAYLPFDGSGEAPEPDATVIVDGDAGAFGDECVGSLDCDLDTVCRAGRCVEQQCADTALCGPGEVCAQPGYFAVDGEDIMHVCTQTYGCDYEWARGCADGRPYCNFGNILYEFPNDTNPTCPDGDPRPWE